MLSKNETWFALYIHSIENEKTFSISKGLQSGVRYRFTGLSNTISLKNVIDRHSLPHIDSHTFWLFLRRFR